MRSFSFSKHLLGDSVPFSPAFSAQFSPLFSSSNPPLYLLCLFSQTEGTKLQKDLKTYLVAVKSECTHPTVISRYTQSTAACCRSVTLNSPLWSLLCFNSSKATVFGCSCNTTGSGCDFMLILLRGRVFVCLCVSDARRVTAASGLSGRHVRT